MKELAYINKYFVKYKWHFLFGIVFVSVSNYFRILQPQYIREAMDLVVKQLAEIQTITCDNIHALSNTCIDAVKTSLQNKNPIDIIHNQTKAITEIQKIYSNMFSTISKASAEIVKQNYNFSWFNQNKK